MVSKQAVLVPLNAVGCGQGGSNIALAGEKLGLFTRMLLANTTTADQMTVDESRRILCLDPDNPRRGAGKDAFRGRSLFKQNYVKVTEQLTLNFQETPPDSFYVVTFSLGGGSGNGMANLMALTLKKMADAPVLAVATWPEKNLLDTRVAANTLMGMEECAKGALDSLFLVDNDKIYAEVRKGKSLEIMNAQIWKPWRHLLSYVGKSSYATMDVQDFDRLIRKGRCAAVFETTVQGVDSAEVLRSKMIESWDNDQHLYLEEFSAPHRLLKDGGDYGFALVVAASPATLSRKRSLMEALYSSLDSLIPATTADSYKTFVSDNSLSDGQIRIITLFTGLPYPVERVNDLTEIIKAAKAQRTTHGPTSFLDGLSISDLRDDHPTQTVNLADLWGTSEEQEPAAPQKSKSTLDELDALIGTPTPPRRRRFGS